MHVNSRNNIILLKIVLKIKLKYESMVIKQKILVLFIKNCMSYEMYLSITISVLLFYYNKCNKLMHIMTKI